jgi:hypothetical protein
VPRTIEVTELRISAKTAAKILKRTIHADEVRAAVENVGRLVFWWVEDEERGRRAYLPIELQGKEAVAVLYPAEGELGTVWNLGSAYFLDE